MKSQLLSLERELDLWGEAGICAELWWRDDDAGSPRPELKQVLDLTQDLSIPLHLAVIPSEAHVDSLAGVKDPSLVMILVHGWSHANHEPEGGACSELGGARPCQIVLAEIAAGITRLTRLFGEQRVLPVLVPPWNSISPSVVEGLAEIGIRGISCMGARNSPMISPGVVQINAHVDVVDWRREPCFVGTGMALAQLIGHLRARRLGGVDFTEPTGIMTHHWAADHGCRKFLKSLGRMVNEHPAARWVKPDWHGTPD